jgi:polysaccharide transporter, PST family
LMIYSRLLSPKQFGLMAMTNTVFLLILTFRDFGLAQSTIQRSTLNEKERSDVFWLNALATLVGFVAMVIAAPLTAYFYGEDDVEWLLLVSAIPFCFWGIQAQHAANLRRNMRFWPVVVAETTGWAIGLISGTIVAVIWQNVWALVVSNLLSAASTALLNFAADPWLPRHPSKFREISKILSWGRDITVFNLLNYLTSNLGQILIGHKNGAAELGQLNRAQQIYAFPNTLLFVPLSEILFPLLSRVQNDHQLFREYFLTFLRQGTLIFFGIGAILPIISHDLVTVLLGPAWNETADMLAWFAPAFFAPGLSTPAGLALTSQGRAAELRNWSVLDFVFRAAGAFAGLPFGAIGVVKGTSLAMLFGSTPAIMILLGRQGAVSLSDQVKVMLASLVVAAAAAAGAYLGLEIGEARALVPLARLVVECLCAFAVSGIVAMLLPQTRQTVLSSVRFIWRALEAEVRKILGYGNSIVGAEDAVRQPVVPHELPDILDGA